jgi:hypothetical protein
MVDTNITNGDLQELLRSNPMAAQQLEAISARRERDEAQEDRFWCYTKEL